MEIKQLPKTLHDITLEEWIRWQDMYGRDLLKRAKKKKSEDEALLFDTEFYLKHYAYYSNTLLAEVEAACYGEDTQVVEVVKESALSQAMLFREMVDLQLVDLVNTEFSFDGYIWRIKPPFVIDTTKELTIEQFERSQDIALIFSDLQDGKFEALLDLCAEYLQTINKDIPTIDYMKSLPLSIALCVKKYVEDTINLYKTLTHAVREPNTS